MNVAYLVLILLYSSFTFSMNNLFKTLSSQVQDPRFSPDMNKLLQAPSANRSPSSTDLEVASYSHSAQNSPFQPIRSPRTQSSCATSPNTKELTLKELFHYLMSCDLIAKKRNNSIATDLSNAQLSNFKTLDLANKKIEKIDEDSARLLDEITLDLILKHVPYQAMIEIIEPGMELVTLNLSQNSIQAIPEGLFDISTLKNLDLSHNKIQYLPLAVARLKELEELNIANNNLSGLPLSIKDLKSLKKFNVKDNDNLTVTPTFIADLKRVIIYDEKMNPSNSLCVTPDPIVPLENQNESPIISPSLAVELSQTPLSPISFSDLDFVKSSIKTQPSGSR